MLTKARAVALAAGTNIRVMQLGDMYELWVGLQNAFEAPKDLKQRFVRHWITECETETDPDQRRVIEQLKDLCNLSGGALLSGNHDNYARKLGHFRDPGILVEHGHQSDLFNKGKAPHDGWALTQLAFKVPQV